MDTTAIAPYAHRVESAAPGRLADRERELGRIRALLDDAGAGHSEALALRGEPGIGKTALLNQARAMVGPDAALLEATGVEGESDIPYAALVTPLAPILSLIDHLAPRQRAALASSRRSAP